VGKHEVELLGQAQRVHRKDLHIQLCEPFDDRSSSDITLNTPGFLSPQSAHDLSLLSATSSFALGIIESHPPRRREAVAGLEKTSVDVTVRKAADATAAKSRRKMENMMS